MNGFETSLVVGGDRGVEGTGAGYFLSNYGLRVVCLNKIRENIKPGLSAVIDDASLF